MACMSRLFIVISSFLFFLSPLWARVVRVEIRERDPILEGEPYPLVGPYERITGRVHFAVDPELGPNRIITDIRKAPRNDQGDVEFSSDFVLMKPVRVERGNGALLYEVSNRGGKNMLGFFSLARFRRDPMAREDFGDGFLMRRGFTLLWLGWQLDPPHTPGNVRVYPAIARDPEGPVTGLVRCDFVVKTHVEHRLLSDRRHIPYPVSDPNDPENSMTVRDAVEGERRMIPRDRWRFARMEGGRPVPDPTRVLLEGGFEPSRIYEVVYRAQDPPLVGLGPAAVRDMMSHLKYEGDPDLSIPRSALNRALGYGSSQSGRFLRTFLYQGFNEDEKNRPAFDGLMPHVAGAGRGSFNHRFAQPSRDAQPFANFFYPTDIFPFTGTAQTDPVTGQTDGLLIQFSRPELCPKIFYINTSYEYWGRASSLIHTTLDGTQDVELMDQVRHYLFTGSQHSPGRFPPDRTSGQQLNNPLEIRWTMRALLVALDRWVADGVTPPPSRYPRLDRDTLVPFPEFDFPQLPGVRVPTRIHRAYRVDYGPRFRSEGIVSFQPPRVGAPFPILVPKVDADGNELAGIRLPEVAVPLATYTGWNLFGPGKGPPTEICSFRGSYIPFARSKQERLEAGDPRPSIQERYGSRDEYLGRVVAVALKLMDEGYLLSQDVPRILEIAAQRWDYLMR